jgi:hypothetical protein
MLAMKHDSGNVLIVAASPLGHSDATAFTMKALFSGFGKGNICQIYDSKINPDSAILSKSWRVVPRYSALREALRFIMIRLPGRSGDVGAVIAKSGHTNPTSPPVARLGWSGLLGELLGYRLDSSVIEGVKDFGPSVIYSPAGSFRWLILALKVSRKVNVPLILHFMDDWPAVYGGKTILGAYIRWRVGKLLKFHLPRSRGTAVISDDMGREYEARYGGTYSTFINSAAHVDIVSRNLCGSQDILPDGIRLVYVGGLHLGRASMLLRVASAISQFATRHIVLRVYVPQKDIELYGSALLQFSCVEWVGSVEASETGRAMCTGDVLLHLESFDPDMKKFTRLSVSTKIPQYLSIGIPLFGIGPGDVSSLRYIKSSGSGEIWDADIFDVDFVRFFEASYFDAAARKMMGKLAHDRFWNHHDSAIVSTRFRDFLLRI